MLPMQQDVKDFMEGVGQPAPTSLTTPDYKTALLRYNLIKEELEELKTALGLYDEKWHEPWDDPAYNEAEFDPIEVVDALTDILYVTFGAAVAMGIDLESAWKEVQKSNMTKLIDGFRREDGKWMKGPSYVAPNLESIREELFNECKTD